MKYLQGVVERLREQSWTGWDVLRWKLLPTPLMHVFACDCVERMALLEASFGNGVPDSFSPILQVKREWTADMTSTLALSEATEKAYQLPRTWQAMGRAQVSCERLVQGLVWSLGKDGFRASMATSVLGIKFFIWQHVEPEGQPAAQWDALARMPGWHESLQVQEEAWQNRRIVWLCEMWNVCGVRTPWLLCEGTLPVPIDEDAAIDADLAPL